MRRGLAGLACSVAPAVTGAVPILGGLPQSRLCRAHCSRTDCVISATLAHVRRDLASVSFNHIVSGESASNSPRVFVGVPCVA
jgi:hypothetical protein